MKHLIALAAVLGLGACTLDTELPPPPAVGLVTGTLLLPDGVTSADRQVQLFTPSGQKLVTPTGDDGRFTFGELTPGLYTLVFRLPPFEQLVVPAVKVSSGQTTDVGELRPASLKGTPVEGTINGVVSAMGGGSVFGATLDVLLPPANDKLASVAVGANGLFSIRVPPARYLLRASHPNYITTELPDVVVMEAALTDLSMTPLVMAINPATVNGTVLKERDGLNAVPAAGALVTLDTGATTTTDSEGKFTLTGLPAGVRAVRYSLMNYVDPAMSRTVDLRAGMGSTVPPVTLLLARGSINGVVELTDRAPLDVAAVTLTGTSSDAGVQGTSGYGAVVSPDPAQPWRGTYTISNVPYGTYEVAASRQRYSRATTIVTVGEVPVQASTLQLTPQLGEFEIDDGDPESTLGFTRRTNVTLNFTRFPTSGIADYRVSTDPNFTDAGFVPYVGPQVPFELEPPDGGSDGVKVIYAQYRQTGGATSPVFQNSIVLDRVPPSAPTVDVASTGTIGQGASLRKFTTSNQVLPLTVTGTDDRAGLSGMRLSGSNAVTDAGVLLGARLAYQASTAFTRSLTSDGEQRVFVQLVDNAGNVSALGQDGVFVDTQPPTGSLSIPRGLRATVNGFTNQPQVEVTPMAGVEPNGGVVQVKLANATGPELDGAPYSVVRPNIPWTLAFGADGLRTVFAVLRDSAGNTSSPINTTITLDTTPPSPVSAALVEPSPTNLSTVQVQVASSAMDLSPTQAITVSDDPGFTSSGTVGPAPMPATGRVPFLLAPGDGLRTLYVRFRDGAGNDSVSPVTFTVDREPPAGTITIVGALADGTSSTTLTATTAVTIEARVTGATRYRLGDASMTTCSTLDSDYTALPPNGVIPFVLTGTGATRTVRGCFRDAAGNLLGGGAPFQPSDTIAFDADAPTGCTLSVQGFKRDRTPAPAGLTAQVEVTAQLTGCVGATAISIVAGPSTCATARYESPGPLTIALPPGDGMKTVTACARDDARNTVSVTPVTLTLDTTAPTPVSASLVESSPTNLLSVQVQVASTAMDLSATEAITVSEDATFSAGGTVGPSPMPPSGRVSYTLSPGDGLRTLYVRFRDTVGNDTVTSVTLTLDRDPPTGTITIIGALADGTPSTAVTATANVTIDARITGATRYRLGDASMTTCSLVDSDYTSLPASGLIPFVLTGNTPTRTVRGCFRDAAGNVLGGGAPFQPFDTIAFDADAPMGCQVAVQGFRTDASPAPAGLTAKFDVQATLINCTAPEWDVVVGPISCATARYDRVGPVTLNLPAGDGPKTISACVRDDARNSTTAASAVITLDTTPPSNTSIEFEGGDGYVNVADLSRPQNAGQLRALGVATFTNASEVRLTFPRSGMAPVTIPLTVSPQDLSVLFPADGKYFIEWVFADQLGNTTSSDDTSVTVDTAPPPPPLLTVVDMGNRSARLFWDLVPAATQYQLMRGNDASPPSFLAATVTPTGGAGEGVILNLVNRAEYSFAVRSVDPAGNPSANSNTLTATTGWRRVTLPLNTTFPVRPLDIALRGSEVFVVYSERDAEWLAETGNLRMAYSPDLGSTWSFSQVDGVFGWDRRVAHLTTSPSVVTVVSAGTDQDPASPVGSSLGELRVFSSTDGIAWTNLGGGVLGNVANATDTTSAGAVHTGSIGRFFSVRGPGTTNVIQLWSAIIGTGFFFGLPSLSTYYDAPDNVQMKDFRTCSGNFATVHAWREAGQVRALWHRFFGDIDFTVGTEGSLEQVASVTADAMDLACAAQTGSTDAFVVYRIPNASPGGPGTLGFRKKLGVTGSWTGSIGATMPTDVDPLTEPRLYAAGSRVVVVYRSTTGAVRIGESNTSGDGLVFRRVEANPQQGRFVVIGGDSQTTDVAMAWTDADSASITVLVPALRGIAGRALPGINTAVVAWSSGGQSKFRVDRTENLFSNPTWTDSFFTTQATWDVPVPPTTAAFQHQLSAVDAYNQGTTEGEVWQVAPFQQSTLIPSPVAPTAGPSSSAGIVAHDDAVLVLPPFGFKASGSSDLTVYTSTNAGATMSPLSPPSAVTTTARRVLVGANGRAILAYRLGASSGLRARIFGSLTPGTFPAEQLVDATTNVDQLGALADVDGNVAIATGNAASDQITFSWYEAAAGAFTTQGDLTIPNAAADTIREVAVWRTSPARVVIAWRQAGASTERIYYVEATRVSAAPIGYSYGVPVLLHDGSTAAGGNQRVSASTTLSGGSNGSYSVLGHVTAARIINPTTTNNLFLSVTGTEHPNAATNFASLTVDQQPAVEDSFSIQADDRGVFALYQANELGASPTQTQLKMAVCYADCHLLQSWWRRALLTVPSSNTQMAPVLGLATTSGNPPYRIYAMYKEGGQLKFLRGGSLRRTR